MFTHTSDTFAIPRAYISYTIFAYGLTVAVMFAYLIVQLSLHAVSLYAMDAELEQLDRDKSALEARQVKVTQELTRDYALKHGYVALDARMYAGVNNVAMVKR